MVKRIERKFTLEYWTDGNWLVGRLREVPSVFSQGRTLTELQDNIVDAFELMLEEHVAPVPSDRVKTEEVEIAI